MSANQEAFTIECAHEGLEKPTDDCVVTKGKYDYYHYKCDGVNDVGWGCGYRTLQTLCSWIRYVKMSRNKEDNKIADVPSVLQIQKILVECGDKPSNFVSSRQWIGCFEASIVIDYLYDVPCKILHCEANNLGKYYQDLWTHFNTINSPIMQGGDLDNESKGILGIARNSNDNYYFLVADPHCCLNKPSKESLHEEGWVKWQNSKIYENSSFYNFCLPQLK